LSLRGKIAEDDEVFQFLYEGVNRLIPEIKPLTLSAIVRAINSSSLVEQRVLSNFLSAINYHDSEVRDTALELFSTLDQIILARSIFVRVSAQSSTKPERIPDWLKKFLSLWRTQYAAIKLHQTVKHTSCILHNQTLVHA
jgi:hypothetical protein